MCPRYNDKIVIISPRESPFISDSHLCHCVTEDPLLYISGLLSVKYVLSSFLT